MKKILTGAIAAILAGFLVFAISRNEGNLSLAFQAYKYDSRGRRSASLILSNGLSQILHTFPLWRKHRMLQCVSLAPLETANKSRIRNSLVMSRRNPKLYYGHRKVLSFPLTQISEIPLRGSRIAVFIAKHSVRWQIECGRFFTCDF